MDEHSYHPDLWMDELRCVFGSLLEANSPAKSPSQRNPEMQNKLNEKL
jgi:hypothetical protein